MSTFPGDRELSLSADWRIDQVCRRFEAAWKSGQRPELENFIGDVDRLERESLLRELLLLDVECRRKRGDNPTEEEYRRRFGAEGDLVREVFQAADGDQTRPDPDRRRAAEGEAWLPAAIGRYRVLGCLGRGGQGDVYRAVHPALGHDVVIKLPRPDLPSEACRKLLDEGRILARLNDPGLVRVLDADSAAGRPFVVFEYVRGRSIAELLSHERIGPRRGARLVAEVALTLERIHRQGVRHGDVKPANVLIDETGATRLLDFGLASLALSQPPPCGLASGTPAYMAPEQARGQGVVGPRTDVFGLGALLYHLLTGLPPWQGPTLDVVIEQARSGRIRPPSQVAPGVPRALERICLRAMACAPEQRYDSAGSMGRALRSWSNRPRFLALGLFGILAVAVLLLSVLWGNGDRPGKELEGELQVRVWSEEDKPGLVIGQDGALPVRNKEQIQIEVRLNQPGHIYLLWIGGGGKVWPLYPWNDGPKLVQKDADIAPPPKALRTAVSSPPAGRGWVMSGRSGLETIVLAARRTPLPSRVSVGRLVGQLPPAAYRRPDEWVALHPAALRDRQRDPEEDSEEIPNDLARVMARLLEHFEVVRAVRFAHQE